MASRAASQLATLSRNVLQKLLTNVVWEFNQDAVRPASPARMENTAVKMVNAHTNRLHELKQPRSELD